MDSDERSGQALQPVTILVRYDDEEGEQEERFSGFLTGDLHAIYIEHYDRLLFTRVEPTDERDVYLETSSYCPLGVADPVESKRIINELTTTLHSITAYEFMTKVIVHVRTEVEFEDLIIPKLLNDTGWQGRRMNE